jgi:uncharacterized MnhB-related membrane protein
MDMMNLFVLMIMLSILVSAVFAIRSKDLVDAIIYFSYTGVGATILFAVMKAPDVALTEATIGTGLVTLVFLSTIRKTSAKEKADEQ